MRQPTTKPRGAIPRWSETPGGSRGRRFNLDFPQALADRIRALAFREDASVSDVVRSAVAAGLPVIEEQLAKARKGAA